MVGVNFEQSPEKGGGNSCDVATPSLLSLPLLAVATPSFLVQIESAAGDRHLARDPAHTTSKAASAAKQWSLSSSLRQGRSSSRTTVRAESFPATRVGCACSSERLRPSYCVPRPRCSSCPDRQPIPRNRRRRLASGRCDRRGTRSRSLWSQ